MPLSPTTGSPLPNPVIEEILRRRFPQTVLFDAVSSMLKANGRDDNGAHAQHTATVHAERERLRALPRTKLLQILQNMELKASADERARLALKQQKVREKDAATEAAKFYNRPAASADFEFWLKADFWSFDESIALLLGKEPSVVNPSTIKREIEAKPLFETKGPVSAFVRAYERLRALGQRSDAMTCAARLQPADVVGWALRVGVVELPQQFQVLALPETPVMRGENAASAGNISSPTRAIGQTPSSDRPSQTDIKKAALIANYEGSWQSILSDFAHANKNGLSAAAKATAHGMWNEEAAVQWAKQNGKLRASLPSQSLSLDQLPRQNHRMKG